MSINLESIVYNLIEVDHFIAKADLKEVNKKIQEIIKKIRPFFPTLAADIHSSWVNLKCPVPTVILAILSRAFPFIRERMDLHQKFEKALSVASTPHDYEVILKECAAAHVVPRFLRTTAWMDAARELGEADQKRASCDKRIYFKEYIKFFLKNGALVTEEIQKHSLMTYVLNAPNLSDVGFPDEELIELLLERGFNLERVTCNFLGGFTDRNFIFYGAGEPSYMNPMLKELISVRDSVVSEMGISLDQLSLKQRSVVARRCHEIFDFQWALNNGMGREERGPLNTPLSPEMEKRVAAHEAFLKAFQSGDLKRAGQLLIETPIDLNAPRVHSKVGSHPVGLLVDVCLKGDVKLVKWLLDAGAAVNSPRLLSNPLLMTILTPCTNQRAIVNLLIEKGADINIKNSYNAPLILMGDLEISMTNFIGFIGEYFDIGRTLNLLVTCGLNVNISHLQAGKEFPQELLDIFPKEMWNEATAQLIYYGDESISKTNFDPEFTGLCEGISRALQLRDDVLSEMIHQPDEFLKKVEVLKQMPIPILGTIEAYAAPLTLTGSLTIGRRCLAKVAPNRLNAAIAACFKSALPDTLC